MGNAFGPSFVGPPVGVRRKDLPSTFDDERRGILILIDAALSI
jgi:hypothetical protein